MLVLDHHRGRAEALGDEPRVSGHCITPSAISGVGNCTTSSRGAAGGGSCAPSRNSRPAGESGCAGAVEEPPVDVRQRQPEVGRPAERLRAQPEPPHAGGFARQRVREPADLGFEQQVGLRPRPR